MKLKIKSHHLMIAAATVGILAGCAGRPSLFPNNDKNLRLTSAQFAADAAKRHPYKEEAPHGGTIAARAEVDYGIKQIEIANLSDTNWDNVEIWINKNYVVFLPQMETGNSKRLPFTMIFDDAGNSLTADSTRRPVASIEICRDGKIYDVTTRLAD